MAALAVALVERPGAMVDAGCDASCGSVQSGPGMVLAALRGKTGGRCRETMKWKCAVVQSNQSQA